MSDVLGGMPTYRPGQTTVQVPQVVQVPGGEAYGALAQSMDRLSRAFNDVAEPIMTTQGQREGQNAVELGEDGRPRAPQLRSEISAAGRAFNVAAVQAYQDQSEMFWSTRFQQMRPQFQNNPEGFLPAARAMIEGAAGEMPEAFRGRIAGRLTMLAQGHARAMIADQQRTQQQQANTAWQMALGQTSERLEAFAFTGQTDSPEAQAEMARLRQHLDAGVAAGHISPQIRDLQLAQMNDSMVAHAVAGRVEAIAREQGPEAASRFLAESLSQPAVAGAGPRAVAQARAEGERRIALFNQERAVQQGDIRDRLTNVRQTISAGGMPTVASLEQLATRAQAAGLPVIAAEFRSLGNLMGELRSFQGMPLPQLEREYFAAEARAQAEGDQNETGPRLRMLADMIIQRRQAISRDPVGWAQTQPGVQEVMQRRLRGEATMSDQIRAQDELLRANNFDPAGHRVISEARVAELRGQLQNLPAREAAPIIARVFAEYGPEHRARLWNDLRNGNLPAEVRAVPLLMVAPGQGDALRRYIALIGEPGAQEAINRRLPTGASGDIDNEINRVMNPLVGSMSGTEQDTGLLNDSRGVIRLLASAAVANGRPFREAVAEAYRQVVTEGWQIVEGSRGSWRVPRGIQYDDAQFRRVTSDLLNSDVFANVRFRVPDGAVGGNLDDDQRQRAYRSSLASGGRWRTDEDGRGVMLVDTNGQPVFLDDGRRFRIRFDEVREGIYPTGNVRGVRPDLSILRPVGGYYGALFQHESGFRNDARPLDERGQPRSSALGIGQFIDRTWLAFARERRELFPMGASEAQILAMRRDPLLQMQATHWYAQRNATALQAAGQPVNDFTVGLAHGHGSGGALTLLRAAPNTPFRQLFSEQVVTANPWWADLTAGQVLDTFRRRFGTGQTWRDEPAVGRRVQVAQARPTDVGAPPAARE